jgi:hypothetical protein
VDSLIGSYWDHQHEHHKAIDRMNIQATYLNVISSSQSVAIQGRDRGVSERGREEEWSKSYEHQPTSVDALLISAFICIPRSPMVLAVVGWE